VLTRLELKNFSAHAHREIFFSPKSHVLIGPNGSGKSTVLAAIAMNINGSSYMAGSKDANISQFATKGEPSYVSADYLINGNEISVFRSLGRDKSWLSLNGTRVALGETDVNAKLSELWIDVDLVARVAFARQGEFAAWVRDTPANRAAFLSRIYGTERCARDLEILRKELNAIPAATTVDFAAIDCEFDDAANLLHAAEEACAAADEAIVECSAAERIVAAAAAVEAASKIYADAVKKRDNLVGDKAIAKDAVTTAARALEEAQEALDSYSKLERDREAWDRYSDWQHRYEQAQQDYAELLKLEAVTNPPMPEGYKLVSDWRRERIADGAAEIKRIVKLLKMYDDGTAACPTCGVTGREFSEVIEATRESLTEKRATLKRREAALARDIAYEEALETYSKAQRSISLRRPNCLAVARRLTEVYGAGEPVAPSVPKPPAARTSKDKLISARDRATDAHNAANNKLSVEKGRLAACLETVALAARELNAANDALDEYLGGESDEVGLRKAYAAIKANDAAVSAAHDAAVVVMDRKEQFNRVKAKRAKAKAAAADTELIDGWRSLLEECRRINNFQNAPRRVIHSGITETVAIANERLAAVEMPFELLLNPDMSFTAVFFDGIRRHGTERLSEGQTVMAALALWTGLNSRTAGGIGLLCLDEPTLHLDRQNVAAIGPALQSFHALSPATQIICVTHEEPLSGYFDKATELESL